jgi:uncharacterized protein YhaN
MRVDGFGVWSGVEIGEVADRATVFYGPNEAGKTTLMQFVRSVLYGFSPARRRRYLPPVNGGTPGGTLWVECEDGTYVVRRQPAGDGSPEDVGNVSVIAPDGKEHANDALEALLGGVDEAIYNNVFAVGLRELQELGTLDDTNAADYLYRLTGGLDRVSLVEVMRELTACRLRLLGEGSDSQISRLLAERSRLAAEANDGAMRLADWERLEDERGEIDRELSRLDEALRAAEREARVLEAAAAMQATVQRRRELEAELAQAGELTNLPDRSLESLLRLSREIAACTREIERSRRGHNVLRRRANELNVNRKLARLGSRVEALSEQAAWLASLETQVAALDAEIADLESQWRRQAQAAGWESDAAAEGIAAFAPAPLSRRVLARLRGPARALRREKARLKEARQQAMAAGKEAAELRARLEGELAGRGTSELAPLLEKAGNQVSQLRRRVQLDERLQQLARHRTELEDRGHDLVEHQVLPMSVLAGLGGLFAIGVMLVLAGVLGNFLFSLTAAAGFALAILGLGGIAGAVALKLTLERSAGQRLSACQNQLALLKTQTEEATAERDRLDETLPRGGGPLVSRLQSAERELAALEELLPIDGQRQAARQRKRAAQAEAASAERACGEALHRWRAALREAGLPESLTPVRLRRLADGHEDLSAVARRLAARRLEREHRGSEWNALSARIADLAGEAGLDSIAEGPAEQFRGLIAAWASQQQAMRRRQRLLRRAARLQKQWRKLARRRARLRHRRWTILDETGIASHDRRRLGRRLAHVQSLRRQQHRLREQIAAAILGICSIEELERAVAERDRPQPSTGGLSHPTARRLKIDEQRRRLYERRGGIEEQSRALTDDGRPARARLALHAIDQRLGAARRQWQVLAATERMLHEVRRHYETKRQPETLREASEYLSRLTGGHYVRVWTPLEERTLLVDDAEGSPLPIEVLSRGTREGVFLSLRLALAAAYARRGANLPLVLDDVLVNLDSHRAKGAASVLCEFAKAGHQVLLFTCHEHIANIFRGLRCPVRELPEPIMPRRRLDDAGPLRVPKIARRRRSIEEHPAPVVAAPLPTEAEVEEELWAEEIPDGEAAFDNDDLEALRGLYDAAEDEVDRDATTERTFAWDEPRMWDEQPSHDDGQRDSDAA